MEEYQNQEKTQPKSLLQRVKDGRKEEKKNGKYLRGSLSGLLILSQLVLTSQYALAQEMEQKLAKPDSKLDETIADKDKYKQKKLSVDGIVECLRRTYERIKVDYVEKVLDEFSSSIEEQNKAWNTWFEPQNIKQIEEQGKAWDTWFNLTGKETETYTGEDFRSRFYHEFGGLTQVKIVIALLKGYKTPTEISNYIGMSHGITYMRLNRMAKKYKRITKTRVGRTKYFSIILTPEERKRLNVNSISETGIW